MTKMGESEPSYKKQILGVVVGLLMSILFTLGGVTVQALDKLVPVFQLNAIRLAGMDGSQHISLQ